MQPKIVEMKTPELEQAAHQELVVPIRDVQALMEKISVLYENRGLRDEMGRKARRRAEDFTWRRYRQRLGGLVRGFVGEQSDVSIGRLTRGGWLGKSLSLR